MKVKNLMFFGVAAAILSIANAEAATAAHPTAAPANSDKPIVTSKYYVDNKFKTLEDDMAQVAFSGDYTNLTNTPTIPSAAGEGTHITTSTNPSTGVITINVSDITDSGNDIAADDTGLTTGKAVYEYVGSVNSALNSSIDDKQDKDADAVENNIADFDSNGNSKDSGKGWDSATGTLSTTNNTSVVPTSAQVIGYVSSVTSGMASEDYVDTAVSTLQTAVNSALDDKQDKVTTAVENHIATWDSAGQTKDSGVSVSSAAIDSQSSNSAVPTAAAVYSAISSATAVDSETFDSALDTSSENAVQNKVLAPNPTSCNSTTPCAWVNGTWNAMAI